MAQFEKVEKSPFSSPKEGFEKTLELLPGIGIEIWKKREIANLILARKKSGENEIQCNIMFNFNDTVSISLDSPIDNEDTLKDLAEEIFATLDA